MFVYTVQLHPGKKGFFECTLYTWLAGWLAKMKKSKSCSSLSVGYEKYVTALLNFLGMDDDTAWYTGYSAYRLQAACRLQIPLS